MDKPTGQSDVGNFLIEASSPMALGCIQLIIKSKCHGDGEKCNKKQQYHVL